MLGAIIGDIAGSRFEPVLKNRRNRKSKDFIFLSHSKGCEPTDDSIMTLAVARAILLHDGTMDDLEEKAISSMRWLGPKCGNLLRYGPKFREWLTSPNPQPYKGTGNGAAMRVSPCGFAASSLEEAKSLADAVTKITHNSPEGMKAAEAVSTAIFLARQGKSIQDIRKYVENTFHYRFDFTLDGIRRDYKFYVDCEKSVPQAFEAFFESTGFEDAIRNAISIGGDSDTIGTVSISTKVHFRSISNCRKAKRSVANTFLPQPKPERNAQLQSRQAFWQSFANNRIVRKLGRLPQGLHGRTHGT